LASPEYHRIGVALTPNPLPRRDGTMESPGEG
jgi:hypothetical protein